MPQGEPKIFVADLHIHSVLSPCAEREMLPQCIILEALEKKIDIIALCDHNACDNVEVMVTLGNRFGVWVIPGIEVETKEEVHLLCYFPSVNALRDFNTFIANFLPRVPLQENIWGEEWVVDEEGQIVEKKDYLIVHPVNLSLEEVCAAVHRHRGVVVPAHVDRKSYSIFFQLGFIPPHLEVDAVEISPEASWKEVVRKFRLDGFQAIRSSDAHTLREVGLGWTYFSMFSLSWLEFVLALHGEKGRKTILP